MSSSPVYRGLGLSNKLLRRQPCYFHIKGTSTLKLHFILKSSVPPLCRFVGSMSKSYEEWLSSLCIWAFPDDHGYVESLIHIIWAIRLKHDRTSRWNLISRIDETLWMVGWIYFIASVCFSCYRYTKVDKGHNANMFRPRLGGQDILRTL